MQRITLSLCGLINRIAEFMFLFVVKKATLSDIYNLIS